MYILDTQIISYAFKGVYDGQVTNQFISSVTAKEFLLAQGVGQTSVGYHIPQWASSIPEIRLPSHKYSKNSTDRITLDFGSDYPPIIEYGNLAISKVINQRAKKVLRSATGHFKKEKRKIILDRFDFLIGQSINCLSLNKYMAELGLTLFHEFISRYNLKENFRNSINDILILASAINSSGTLVTEDSLLNKFAAERYDASMKEYSGTLLIDFGKIRPSIGDKNKESKGYVNRGWNVQEQKYPGAW